MDLGSVTNAMEEPAVELPLLTDPWSIVINVNDHLRNGPGISQRAAAAVHRDSGVDWSLIYCLGTTSGCVGVK